MRRVLKSLAALLALATVLTWLFLGAHVGWTQTSVAVKKVDPVTEIEYDEWQDRFVPGVDFLAAGILASGVLLGISLLVPKSKSKNTENQKS